jgi:hypothetical protein
VLHFAGSLKRTHAQFRPIQTHQVENRTLNDFGPEHAVTDVRFIKVDVEGGEREVLDGAREIVARDRAVMLVELLFCESCGYDTFIFQRDEDRSAADNCGARQEYQLGHRNRITQRTVRAAMAAA